MFQAECSRWIDFLGLYEYRIVFVHDPDNMEDEAAGWCMSSLDNGTATIALGMHSPDPVDEDSIRATARHEILELLMWPMFEVAARRYVTLPQIHQARHNIIRRLESVLDRTLDK